MKVKHFIKCVGTATPVRITKWDKSPLFVGEAYKVPKWIAAMRLLEIRATDKNEFMLLTSKED